MISKSMSQHQTMSWCRKLRHMVQTLCHAIESHLKMSKVWKVCKAIKTYAMKSKCMS